MAQTERLINASPEAVFGVLADPRGYAYWVIGSLEVREADPEWPRPGSRFGHTVALGPLRVKDQTVVEEARPPAFLELRAKGRPLGNARVKLELEPEGQGTRVRMVEDPADKPTAFIFMPLTHLLMRKRNVRSLERLAELAEGRRPMPGEEPGAPVRTPNGDGAVVNPAAREDDSRQALRLMARGAAAGLAGAVVMSVSTNAEMRLRGRAPSDAPAKAISRVLGIGARGRRRKMLLGLGGHLATGVSLGVVRGLLDRAGLGSRASGLALFGAAMAPELVVVPALGAAEPPWEWGPVDAGVSMLHHAVYATATNSAYSALEGPGS